MKLYVGNLSFNTTEQGLTDLFTEIGPVQSANIIEDRETGRSRGFGFVEMSSQQDGENAIAQFNGKEVDGRNLKVNEAKPQTNGGGGRGGVSHRNKSEAARAAGDAIIDEGHFRDGAVLFEKILKIVLGSLKGEISYV